MAMSTVNEQIDKINTLTNKIATDVSLSKEDADLFLETIDDNLKNIPKYFSAVIDHTIYRARKDSLQLLNPTQYEYNSTRLDENRRNKHIMMTNGINIINRIGSKYGIKVFDTGLDRDLVSETKKNEPESIAIEDRNLAALLCYDFCKEIFLQGTNVEKYLSKDEHENSETELFSIAMDIKNGEKINFSENLTHNGDHEIKRSDIER